MGSSVVVAIMVAAIIPRPPSLPLWLLPRHAMDPGTIVADQLHGVGMVAEEILARPLGDSAQGLRVVARELGAVNVRVTQAVIVEICCWVMWWAASWARVP